MVKAQSLSFLPRQTYAHEFRASDMIALGRLTSGHLPFRADLDSDVQVSGSVACEEGDMQVWEEGGQYGR